MQRASTGTAEGARDPAAKGPATSATIASCSQTTDRQAGDSRRQDQRRRQSNKAPTRRQEEGGQQKETKHEEREQEAPGLASTIVVRAGPGPVVGIVVVLLHSRPPRARQAVSCRRRLCAQQARGGRTRQGSKARPACSSLTYLALSGATLQGCHASRQCGRSSARLTPQPHMHAPALSPSHHATARAPGGSNALGQTDL